MIMGVPWKLGKKPAYQKQEERTGKKQGGKPQMNSGRVWSSLRDVKRKVGKRTFLYDSKTRRTSFQLTRVDFDLLKRDSNRTPPGCLPVLQIDFTQGVKPLRLVVIEEDVFDDLVEGR